MKKVQTLGSPSDRNAFDLLGNLYHAIQIRAGGSRSYEDDASIYTKRNFSKDFHDWPGACASAKAGKIVTWGVDLGVEEADVNLAAQIHKKEGWGVKPGWTSRRLGSCCSEDEGEQQY
jgi:hypothetical protein